MSKDNDVTKETPVALPKDLFKKVSAEITEENKEILQKLADSDFTHSALGLYKDTVKNEWVIVEFKFDPKTLKVAPNPTLTVTDNTRMAGIEKFKIDAQNKVLNKP